MGRVGPQRRPGDSGPQVRSGRARSDVRPRARRAHLAIRRRDRRLRLRSHRIATDSTAARGEPPGSRASIRKRPSSARGGAWTTGRSAARRSNTSIASRSPPIAGTDIYLGGFADRRAGALQPLSYVRELARVALAAGARIHAGARVVTLDADGSGWRAVTATGATVRAETVLIATNAYADGLVPGLARSIVALNSLQIATAPIPPPLAPDAAPERRNAVRHAPGDPLLAARRRGPPADGRSRSVRGAGFGARLEPSRARRAHAFPGAADVPFTHRWGGRVAVHVDYMPRLHRPQPAAAGRHGLPGARYCVADRDGRRARAHRRSIRSTIRYCRFRRCGRFRFIR